MNTAKRAFLYITRKRKNSWLLFIILFVMTFLVLNSLTIYQTVDDTTRELRERLGGFFQINSSQAKGLINDELIEKVVNEEVKDYNGLNISYMYTKGLMLEPGRFAGTGEYQEFMPRFLGNTKSELFEFFQTDVFQLVLGDHIQPDDKGKALISEQLAEYNQLEVGDIIGATMFEQDIESKEDLPTGQEFPLEIAGIYKMNTNRSSAGMSPECDLWENYIMIDSFTGKKINSIMLGEETSYYNCGVTFFVRDPKEIQSVVEQLQTSTDMDWSKLSININNTAYQNSAAPLEKIEGVIIVLIIVVLVVSILLLSLILTMWIKERVREVGIFLSIGISKKEIIGQFLMECTIIFILALCLSGVASKITTQAVGSYLLKQVTVKDEEDSSTNGDVVESYVKDNLSLIVTTSLRDFFLVFVFGSMVIVVSVGFASIKVLRMKPKSILSSIS